MLSLGSTTVLSTQHRHRNAATECVDLTFTPDRCAPVHVGTTCQLRGTQSNEMSSLETSLSLLLVFFSFSSALFAALARLTTMSSRAISMRGRSPRRSRGIHTPSPVPIVMITIWKVDGYSSV
eukprot:762674-Hanusia_phi.AAC.5